MIELPWPPSVLCSSCSLPALGWPRKLLGVSPEEGANGQQDGGNTWSYEGRCHSHEVTSLLCLELPQEIKHSNVGIKLYMPNNMDQFSLSPITSHHHVLGWRMSLWSCPIPWMPATASSLSKSPSSSLSTKRAWPRVTVWLSCLFNTSQGGILNYIW